MYLALDHFAGKMRGLVVVRLFDFPVVGVIA